MRFGRHGDVEGRGINRTTSPVQKFDVLKADQISKGHRAKMPAEGGSGSTFDQNVIPTSNSKRARGGFGEIVVDMTDVVLGT
jgi:hypothetical protein